MDENASIQSVEIIVYEVNICTETSLEDSTVAFNLEYIA
jgi:hypothetical protein